jgi:hypothetical protein
VRGVRIMALLAFAFAGCSFVGVHYPDARPTAGPVRCITTLPIADTIGASAALAAGGYRYAVETRTSPFPLAMLAVGAWATASAIYGYREDARCRSDLASAR